jgi:hypothetical protein
MVKHATVININEKNLSIDEIMENVKDISSKRKTNVLKCMDMDYNLLPLATFIIKMRHTIYYTKISVIKFHNMHTSLVAFMLYVLVVPTILIVLRSIVSIHKLPIEPSDRTLLSDGDTWSECEA